MLKFTKIDPIYKNKFVAEINIEHGDADKEEFIEVVLDTEEEVLNIEQALRNKPTPSSHGGDEKKYNNWCDDNFGEMTIPYDLVYNDLRATVCDYGHNFFFYNEDGVKFRVTFE